MKLQEIPGTRNVNKVRARDILIKLLKTNDKKILKAAREKGTLCKGTNIRMAVDFLLETM